MDESTQNSQVSSPVGPVQEDETSSLGKRLSDLRNYLSEDKFVLVGVIVIGVLVIFGGATLLLSKIQNQSTPKVTPGIPISTSSPSVTSVNPFRSPQGSVLTSSPSASASSSASPTPTPSPSPTPSASPSLTPSSSPSPSPSPTSSPTASPS